MVRHSSDKKNKLDRRDVKQTRLALRLLDGEELSASKLESAEERQGLKKTSLHRTFGRDLKAIGAEGIPLSKRRDRTSTFYRVDEALLAGPTTTRQTNTPALSPRSREDCSPSPARPTRAPSARQ